MENYMKDLLTKRDDVTSVNHRFFFAFGQVFKTTFKYFIITAFQYVWAAEPLAQSLFDAEHYEKVYGIPKEAAYEHYQHEGAVLGNQPNHWLIKIKIEEVLEQASTTDTPLLQYAKSATHKLEQALEQRWNCIIGGAGFAGSVMARQLADAGHSVLVLEKRPYLGGNAHDFYDEHGVLIHLYGPHIFHTNNKKVFEFLSQFTNWRFYEHRVQSVVSAADGKTYPMPINRTTINELYGLDLKTEEECQAYYDSVKIPCAEIRNSEDVVLSLVGPDLCDKFFRSYTAKQWGGLDLKDLSADVLRRIPTRTNIDDRYFSDTYQMMPAEGYTKMFENMLDHPNIKVLCGFDLLTMQEKLKYDHLVFTGPIDCFFGYRFGELPYRSLRFEFEHLSDVSSYQEVGTVNYPNDYDFTRITEFKKLTGQTHAGTTLLKEYPSATSDKLEPLYPVFSAENNVALTQYQQLAASLENVSLIGRLAEFKYYNMDQVTEAALAEADKILQKLSK